MRIACIVSRFNPSITEGLLAGAKELLLEKNLPLLEKDIFYASGAFEIPLLASQLVQKKSIDGVICLGAVIKGETAHFEYISAGATYGLMNEMLTHQKPVSFGILTCYSREQAEKRSGPDAFNKGREAAAAVLETLDSIRKISEVE